MRVRIYQIDPERDLNRVKFESLELLEMVRGTRNVDPSIYREVFNADIDETDPEAIYRRFNEEMHPLFRGHSLSVSDVVIFDKDTVPELVGEIKEIGSMGHIGTSTYTDLLAYLARIEELREADREFEARDLVGLHVPAIEPGAYFCDSVGFKKIDFDESLTHKPENLMRVVYVEPHRAPYVTEIERSLAAEQKAVGGLIEPISMGDGTVLIGNEEAKLIGMEGNRYLDDGLSIIAGPFFICGETEESFRSLTDEEVEKYMERFAEIEEISQEEVEADTGFLVFGM